MKGGQKKWDAGHRQLSRCPEKLSTTPHSIDGCGEGGIPQKPFFFVTTIAWLLASLWSSVEEMSTSASRPRVYPSPPLGPTVIKRELPRGECDVLLKSLGTHAADLIVGEDGGEIPLYQCSSNVVRGQPHTHSRRSVGIPSPGQCAEHDNALRMPPGHSMSKHRAVTPEECVKIWREEEKEEEEIRRNGPPLMFGFAAEGRVCDLLDSRRKKNTEHLFKILVAIGGGGENNGAGPVEEL